MKTAYISLLEKRLAVLNEKEFDLNVWKGSTSLLLSRIFGDDNPYSREIDEIKVDFSSWTLRDATSSYNPKESAKRQGQEILELAIAELQIRDSQISQDQPTPELFAALPEELAQAIRNNDKKAIEAILKKGKKDDLINLFINLLLK